MGAPLVKAQQHSSIRIQDLTKVVMARRRLGLAEKRLIQFEAARNVAYTDDRPCAFRGLPTPSLISAGGNLVIEKLNMKPGSRYLHRLIRSWTRTSTTACAATVSFSVDTNNSQSAFLTGSNKGSPA